MRRTSQGRYETRTTTGEAVRAFVPAPLPPRPPIAWTPGLRARFDRAHVALGRLDAASMLLDDASMFLYFHIRKEAVLSSMIEGTQSTLADLLRYEAGGEPGALMEDVREVSRYVAAMEHGLRRMAEGFPLSLRLLREIHAVLLAEGRGSGSRPGEFRTSQNWIGGTRPGNAVFVPPPPDRVAECMAELERFLHDGPETTPTLLKAALAHVQFETIHPFLDGNGRVGRLLVTLLLCGEGLLRQPLLYLSLHFKTHRNRYYGLLDEIRRTGDWEAWLDFFAEAVETTAEQGAETIRRLHALGEADRTRLVGVGRGAVSARQVLAALRRRPVATAGGLSEATGLSIPTVNKALAVLEGLGIVRETTARRRDRIFRYEGWMAILEAEPQDATAGAALV